MKRNLIKIIGASLLICIVSLFSERILVGAKEIDGLGHSINAITEDYLDCEYKVGSPVLKAEYLEDLKNRGEILEDNSIYRFQTEYNSSNSIGDFVKEYSKSDSFYSSLSSEYADIGASFAAKMISSNSETFKKYINKYYYGHHSCMEIRSRALPNYATDLSEYIENLDKNYITSLNRLNKGMLKYSDFFDMYGTHLIGKAVYGGKLDVFYSIFTNYVSIDNKVTEIQNSINASLFDVNASYNLETISGFTNKIDHLKVTEVFTAEGKGGYGLNITSINVFSKAYSDWYTSIRSNPTLIGYGSDGLIPLWELLPKHLSHLKPIMEEEFQKYATKYYDSIISKFATPSTFNTNFVEVRTDEHTITDSERYNQSCDEVSFDEWGLNISLLKKYYKTVSICIKIDVRELYDGYQTICLYYDKVPWDNSWISEQQFETGSSTYITQYIYFNDLPLTPFYDKLNAFYIRYGASGFGFDTWQSKDLWVSLKFNK